MHPFLVAIVVISLDPEANFWNSFKIFAILILGCPNALTMGYIAISIILGLLPKLLYTRLWAITIIYILQHVDI